MLKILLVEDDKTIVANLTEYLNGAGYIVRSVSGQAAAMAALAEEKAGLVLLDVSLAEGNGFSACRAIKAEFDIPVIFLTASGDEYSTVTGFDLGADDYIPKPFRPRELLSRIKNVLRLTGSTGKDRKARRCGGGYRKGHGNEEQQRSVSFCAGIPSFTGFHQQSGDRADPRAAA